MYIHLLRLLEKGTILFRGFNRISILHGKKSTRYSSFCRAICLCEGIRTYGIVKRGGENSEGDRTPFSMSPITHAYTRTHTIPRINYLVYIRRHSTTTTSPWTERNISLYIYNAHIYICEEKDYNWHRLAEAWRRRIASTCKVFVWKIFLLIIRIRNKNESINLRKIEVSDLSKKYRKKYSSI